MTCKSVSLPLGVLMAMASLAAQEPARDGAPPIRVHRHAGPPYDQVNSYWVETPEGVIIVDAQRYKHQAQYLVDRIRASTTKPVVAILVTHHHPDHTGGLSTLRKAFGPHVPILTSAFTREDIRTDGSGLLARRRQTFGEDFPEPSEVPVPDRVVRDGERLRIAGVRVGVRVLEDVDSPASVVWQLPDHGLVFLGDFAVDRKTPSLRNGTSTSYLRALDLIESESGDYTVGYPGHGEPGPPRGLFEQTRVYIAEVRRQVAAALGRSGSLSPDDVTRIKHHLIERFSLDFDTLLFPEEHDANIRATARELSGASVVQHPTGDSPKQLVRAFIDVVRSGQAPERAAEFLAPTVSAHQMNAEAETTVTRTPQEYADHIREFLRDFGEFRLTITELLADGDRVYVRWRQEGRHLADIDGSPPTGRPLIEIASAVYRVEHGRIVEYWIQIDREGLRAQLVAPGERPD